MPKSASRNTKPVESDRPVPPPARSRDRRVQQLVLAAENLIEERIRDKTASPTETVAIIRLGTAYEEANLERVRAQTRYLEAQEAKAKAETVREELFTNAIAAMSRYQGNDEPAQPQ